MIQNNVFCILCSTPRPAEIFSLLTYGFYLTRFLLLLGDRRGESEPDGFIKLVLYRLTCRA